MGEPGRGEPSVSKKMWSVFLPVQHKNAAQPFDRAAPPPLYPMEAAGYGGCEYPRSRFKTAPRREHKEAPQKPCEPCYNLHILGRWVACSALYCFQLPTAGGSREACKPDAEPASRITKCGLKKDSSRTPQGRYSVICALPWPGNLFPPVPSKEQAFTPLPPPRRCAP